MTWDTPTANLRSPRDGLERPFLPDNIYSWATLLHEERYAADFCRTVYHFREQDCVALAEPSLPDPNVYRLAEVPYTAEAFELRMRLTANAKVQQGRERELRPHTYTNPRHRKG